MVKKLTQEEFISRYQKLYPDFLFNKTVYVNDNTKVEVGCSVCGNYRFLNPEALRNKKVGCPYCSDSRSHGYSFESIELFDKISSLCHINIRHSLNGREFSVHYIDSFGKKKNIKVDGYNSELNLILEFHGDRFHGNLKLFKEDEFCHPYKKITAKELFQRTINKENLLKSLGYNVISIWEYDYNLNRNSYIKNLVNRINILKESIKYEN